MKLLLSFELKEDEEGDWDDTRHTFVVKKKKILPPCLLIFSFLNKASTLKQKLVY